MDAVAAKAGVGKGTVFRRFSSREGLMGALLNFSETEWQASVISGPAAARAGRAADGAAAGLRSLPARVHPASCRADPRRRPGRPARGRYAAYSFAAMHVRYLLGELGVGGDIALLATALLAPLEMPILQQQVRVEGIPVERVYDGWVDLARRIVGTA